MGLVVVGARSRQVEVGSVGGHGLHGRQVVRCPQARRACAQDAWRLTAAVDKRILLTMLGTPSRDRVAERREATRQEILAAAWDVAREQGVAQLTLREVAERVGMRAPSLYTHFDVQARDLRRHVRPGVGHLPRGRPGAPADHADRPARPAAGDRPPVLRLQRGRPGVVPAAQPAAGAGLRAERGVLRTLRRGHGALHRGDGRARRHRPRRARPLGIPRRGAGGRPAGQRSRGRPLPAAARPGRGHVRRPRGPEAPRHATTSEDREDEHEDSDTGPEPPDPGPAASTGRRRCGSPPPSTTGWPTCSRS